jgi:hypothetical protein
MLMTFGRFNIIGCTFLWSHDGTLVYQYQFPSLSFSKKLQPSAEQEQAVAALMASKDLSKPCSEDSRHDLWLNNVLM